MSKVFVLDTKQRALDPVHPGWARKLLSTGQAAVWRRFPFTIILKKEVGEAVTQPLRLKLDPGSTTTGIAIVNDASGEVVFAAELTHRGQQVNAALQNRRSVRRSRRQRKTRYRKPRFDNRKKREGWLAPSLMSRVYNIETWVRRLLRVCPIAALSQELVKFDLQRMENPHIAGVEYQHGTLYGCEVREYLLEKWGRQCAYCDATGVPLQIEHIVCRAKHGSDRMDNLTLACEACNRKKSTQDIHEFLRHDPARLARILAHTKGPLRDAAAVNSTRWVLYQRLQAFGLPVECGSGGRTKYNRAARGIEKAHWTDAACVGASTPERLHTKGVVPLYITAKGHGSRQMCLMDRFGFPRTGPKQAKRVKGFQTGDMVRAVVPAGTHQGTYIGRVAVRSTGSFNLTTPHRTIQGISHRSCTVQHRCDGYEYIHTRKERAFPPAA
jgi:5-methylcytosine-specific restriction endonuclease McrA